MRVRLTASSAEAYIYDINVLSGPAAVVVAKPPGYGVVRLRTRLARPGDLLTVCQLFDTSREQISAHLPLTVLGFSISWIKSAPMRIVSGRTWVYCHPK